MHAFQMHDSAVYDRGRKKIGQILKKYLPYQYNYDIILLASGDGGMADALDSGSSGSYPVRVQVPFSALYRNTEVLCFEGLSVFFCWIISEKGQYRGRLT